MPHSGAHVIQGLFPNAVPLRARAQLQLATQSVARSQSPGHDTAIQLREDLPDFGGEGEPLPRELRQRMESFFGTSFSEVRIHVGSQAPLLGALAFTRGSDIYFAPGQYNPATQRGQELLGHELAHVVQQRDGRVRNPFGAGVAVVHDTQLEVEAELLGRRAAAHGRARAGAPEVLPSTARPVTPALRSPGDSTRALQAKHASGIVQRAGETNKLRIVSWNIRHLRKDKVEEHAVYIRSVLAQADVAFLYENKTDNNKNNVLCQAVANTMAQATGTQCTAKAKYVGTNENVIIAYRNRVDELELDVRNNDSFDNALMGAAENAIARSTNETIMANRAQMRAEARIPAIVDLFAGSDPEGGDMIRLQIAAWHAPGPATALSPLLWNRYSHLLYNDLDLYVGDFNMTGLERGMSEPITPVRLVRTHQSTTITNTGPVVHAEGLDLVYRNTGQLAHVTDREYDGQKALMTASVIQKPGTMTYAAAYDCSDHLPVLVEVEW